MDLDEIKQVLEMMREHDLAEFELERDGVKLRLRKNTGQQWNGTVPPLPQVTFVPPAMAAPAGATTAPRRLRFSRRPTRTSTSPS
jgi:biotin carboxyl carrier protein